MRISPSWQCHHLGRARYTSCHAGLMGAHLVLAEVPRQAGHVDLVGALVQQAADHAHHGQAEARRGLAGPPRARGGGRVVMRPPHLRYTQVHACRRAVQACMDMNTAHRRYRMALPSEGSLPLHRQICVTGSREGPSWDSHLGHAVMHELPIRRAGYPDRVEICVVCHAVLAHTHRFDPARCGVPPRPHALQACAP